MFYKLQHFFSNTQNMNYLKQGRRQGVCLGRAKCLATAAPALKFCAPALKKSLGGGGGGEAWGLRHIYFFFSTSNFPPKL